MQRTARLLSKTKLQNAKLSPEEFAAAVWPAAVGRRLALRTGPVKLYGRKLVVDVEDAVWQRQLSTMSSQILTKLQLLSGSGMIEGVEFRIGAARRGPQTAFCADGTGSRLEDLADGIADPIFRQLYLASRARSEREDSERLRISA